MKRTMIFVFFTLAVSFSFSQSATDAQLTKPEQEVWNKVVALHGAVFGNKDSAVIAGLVSKDLEYSHSSGLLENMQTMVHNASKSNTMYKDFTNERISTKVVGNVGIVRLIIKATSIDKGTESPLNLGLLQVWVKEKGNWHLVERQAVKMVVK